MSTLEVLGLLNPGLLSPYIVFPEVLQERTAFSSAVSNLVCYHRRKLTQWEWEAATDPLVFLLDIDRDGSSKL